MDLTLMMKHTISRILHLNVHVITSEVVNLRVDRIIGAHIYDTLVCIELRKPGRYKISGYSGDVVLLIVLELRLELYGIIRVYSVCQLRCTCRTIGRLEVVPAHKERRL